MDDRPDILWLTLESVRADHTSVYDYDRDTTPHLRRLAAREDATVLTNGVSASNWTRASTASILTGTHLSTHDTGRRRDEQKKLPPNLDTLPELLADSGYATSLFSTVAHISSATDFDRGFDYSTYVTMQPSNFWITGEHTFDSWICALQRFVEAPTLNPKKLKEDLRENKNALLYRKMKRWFRSRSDARNPFFAYAHVWSPHHSYLPIRRFLHSFADEIELDIEEAYTLVDEKYPESKQDRIEEIASGVSFDETEWEAIEALYDSEIRYADYTLDKIVELAETSSPRDLVIVVTGDHGELFGEQGVIGHNLLLHDGVVRVPMVVVGIDDVIDGDDVMTQHIDLTYTLASLTDTLTDQFEGRDIRSDERTYAISQRGEEDLECYVEANPDFDTTDHFEGPVTAVSTPRFKYMESGERRVLYELPAEDANVIDEYPSVAEELSDVVKREGIDWRESTDEGEEAFDEETMNRLRELGYI